MEKDTMKITLQGHKVECSTCMYEDIDDWRTCGKCDDNYSEWKLKVNNGITFTREEVDIIEDYVTCHFNEIKIDLKNNNCLSEIEIVKGIINKIKDS